MKELTAEQREHVKALTAERAKMLPDDPMFRGADLDATWFHRILAEQAAQYERRQVWLWRAIYALLFAVAYLTCLVFL